MNCNQCIKTCQGECCGVVPIPKKTIKRFLFVRVPESETKIGGHVFAYDENGCCAYLGQDFKCSIYKHRPDICKKFGDETHPLLTCRWQDKNGKMRDRSERRRVERESDKLIKRVL